MSSDPYAPPESDLTPASAASVELASRWARLGGALLDSLILIVINLPLMAMTGFWQAAAAGEVSVVSSILWNIWGIVLWLVVNGYLMATRGQSVGKYLVGTRIVAFATGELLPLWHIFFLRFVPMAVLSMIPFFGSLLVMIEVLFIFGSSRRCGHDYLAGTHVVKATATF